MSWIVDGVRLYMDIESFGDQYLSHSLSPLTLVDRRDHCLGPGQELVALPPKLNAFFWQQPWLHEQHG